VGPFKTAPGGYKHILVAVDKFTKWIEVRAVTTVMSKEVAKFIEYITHRFGVPNKIVTDLGKAFTGLDFWDFCQDNLFDGYYSSGGPPAVQQPGRASKRHGASSRQRPHLRRRLTICDKVAHGAASRHLGSPNPSQLSHGILPVLPGIRIRGGPPNRVTFDAPCIQHYEEGTAKETRKVDLDSIEEHCVAALMRHTQYEQQLRRYHDRNVRESSFNMGDLVLHRIKSISGMHKLSAPWEGSFIVMEVVSTSTYRLQWADSQGVPNVWTLNSYVAYILRRFVPKKSYVLSSLVISI
jgi:hypothetical protein